MPLQVAPKQLISERLGNFLGVNLRRDRLSLADEDVARAINFDFHREVGTALSRTRFKQIESGLPVPIRRLRVGLQELFIMAGDTLYNESGVALQTGIDSGATSIIEAKPLTDDPNLFIATPSVMRRTTTGDAVGLWGHPKPTTRPQLIFQETPDVLSAGTYQVVYTHVRRSSFGIAHESNPSAPSLPATLATGRGTLRATVYPSPETDYGYIRIYRTTNGGNTFLFAKEVVDTGLSQQVNI